MKKEYIIATLVIIIVIIGGVLLFSNKNGNNSESKETPTQTQVAQVQNNMGQQWDKAPALTIDRTKNYQAVLKTTEGDITIDLDVKNTPITSNNFVFLVNNKFYDGTIFHRVIKGFMIQGGDPQGSGMGGPGYKFEDEPITKDYKRGTVAMANSGPNTNGSQFFIMHADYPLPKNYVIFGNVTSGLDVVDKIATAEVKMSPSGEDSAPVSPVKINSVTVTEK